MCILFFDFSQKIIRCLSYKICLTKNWTCRYEVFHGHRRYFHCFLLFAGIKPFACFICSETFTRQHSLNYHMLIHNNQNRFTCKDCGRKFRHPSHFKVSTSHFKVTQPHSIILNTTSFRLVGNLIRPRYFQYSASDISTSRRHQVGTTGML